MIKRTLLFALIFVVAVTLISLLLPRKVSIAKSLEIPGHDDCPIQMVANFEKWPQWFPALKDSQSVLRPVSDIEAQLVNNRGNIADIYMRTVTADSASFEIRSGDNEPVEFSFLLSHQSDGNRRLDLIVNTQLKWYPWERAKGIFLDKMAGAQYETALENIRRACADMQ